MKRWVNGLGVAWIERYGSDATATKVANDIRRIFLDSASDVDVGKAQPVISNIRLKGIEVKISKSCSLPDSAVKLIEMTLDELDKLGFPSSVRLSARTPPRSVHFRIGDLLSPDSP